MTLYLRHLWCELVACEERHWKKYTVTGRAEARRSMQGEGYTTGGSAGRGTEPGYITYF